MRHQNPFVIREAHFRRVMVEGVKRDYDALHRTLRRRHRKPKRCWACGEEKPLDWALRDDAEGYSLRLEDFHPLCRSCHSKQEHGHQLNAWVGFRDGKE